MCRYHELILGAYRLSAVVVRGTEAAYVGDVVRHRVKFERVQVEFLVLRTPVVRRVGGEVSGRLLLPFLFFFDAAIARRPRAAVSRGSSFVLNMLQTSFLKRRMSLPKRLVLVSVSSSVMSVCIRSFG